MWPVISVITSFFLGERLFSAWLINRMFKKVRIQKLKSSKKYFNHLKYIIDTCYNPPPYYCTISRLLLCQFYNPVNAAIPSLLPFTSTLPSHKNNSPSHFHCSLHAITPLSTQHHFISKVPWCPSKHFQPTLQMTTKLLHCKKFWQLQYILVSQYIFKK